MSNLKPKACYHPQGSLAELKASFSAPAVQKDAFSPLSSSTYSGSLSLSHSAVRWMSSTLIPGGRP